MRKHIGRWLAASLLITAIAENGQAAQAQVETQACQPAAILDSIRKDGEGTAVLVQEPAARFLAEGVLWHPSGRWFLLSGKQGITRYSADGRPLGSWGAIQPGHSVAGLELDPSGDSVWSVATSAGKSKVVRLSLEGGNLMANYELPGIEQWYGDIAVGPNGAVYVGISRSEGILQLKRGASEFSRLALNGEVRGPQGLFVTPGGGELIVADYTSGLKSVDLHRGTVRSLDWPQANALRGIDGIAKVGNDIVAAQNGTSSFALLLVELDRRMSRVKRVSRMVPRLWQSLTDCKLEPTLVSVRGKHAYVVVRSLIEGLPGPNHQSFLLRFPLKR